MRVHLSTRLAAPPEWVVAQLQSTAVFRYITAPLVHFAPDKGAAWPAAWTPGELSLRLRLFGLVPIGRQQVRICIEPAPEGSEWPTLRDNGEGTLMQRWDHRITVHPLPGGHTWYTDDVELQARYLPWLMTPVSAAFAYWFYRHRQRRWRVLAAQQRQSDRTAPPGETAALPVPALPHRRRAFMHLMQGFATAADRPVQEQWRWLEAAHVLGQADLRLHWRSHVAMLRQALRLRDAKEAAGQLARLALTPWGHLLGKLPQGNSGRATVSAFMPMSPDTAVLALIRGALDATATGQDNAAP